MNMKVGKRGGHRCGPSRGGLRTSVRRGGLLHVTVDGGSCGVRVRALCKARGLRRHIQDFFIIKKTNTELRGKPGQDSPFWTLETGGCMKSLKGPRASFRAELTSDEEHVMHSTSVGYRAIT